MPDRPDLPARCRLAPGGAPGSAAGATGSGAPGTGGSTPEGSKPDGGGNPAGGGSTSGGTGPGGTAPGGGGGFGTGWTKLLGSEYGPQIGWLYPLAALAVVFGVAWTRRARRTQPAGQVRGGFVLWGTWLATYGLIFSKMSTIPHTAYMSSLAPPLAALSGAGIVMFWRAYRAAGWRGWVLPLAVAAEAAWAFFLGGNGGFLPWARDLLVVAGTVAVVALVAARLSRRTGARLVTVALGTGVAAILVAPATWAASVLDVSYAGSSFNATACRRAGWAPSAEAASSRASKQAGGSPRSSLTASPGEPADGGVAAPRWRRWCGRRDRLVRHHHPDQRGAAALRLRQRPPGRRELPDGRRLLGRGLTVHPRHRAGGHAHGRLQRHGPFPHLSAVKDLVRTGQLRFFLISGTGAGAGFGSPGGSTAATIDTWVQSPAPPPATDYASATATSTASAGEGSLAERVDHGRLTGPRPG